GIGRRTIYREVCEPCRDKSHNDHGDRQGEGPAFPERVLPSGRYPRAFASALRQSLAGVCTDQPGRRSQAEGELRDPEMDRPDTHALNACEREKFKTLDVGME